MTLLAVFRSRAQTLDFAAALRRTGVPVQTVNTPKDAGIGCGISAKFEERFLPRARAVLGGRRYSAFAGIMREVQGNYFWL